ncbi:MAG: DinB family protein [Candidatus Entotheonellia bacterium]
MDEAIQLAIEMSEANWNNVKNDLKNLTPEEIDWRPLPQANNINVLVKHLRVVEELLFSRLEQGEQSPYRDGPSVQKLTDSVPQNFDRNMQQLEAFHHRFIAALRATTLAELKRKTFLTPFAQGPQPANTLLLGEISHLATHRGQIRTVRNLYRKARGEQGLFLPQNPTFGES